MATAQALSYSSISTYQECPLRWKFLYIDRLPETPKGYFSFGRTIHSVLEELVRPLCLPAPRATTSGEVQRTLEEFQGRAGPPSASRLISSEEMLKLYDQLWVSEGYTSREEEGRYRTLGADLLQQYRDMLVAAPPAPVAVEEHLETVWDGIPVHGYLDRIDRAPAGGLEVLDYKTGRELRRDDAVGSDQLSIYQVLVEKNYALPVERLTLYHLRSQTPISVPPRKESALTELHGRVGEVSDGIRAQSFEPTPGRHCARCEFQSLCPEFRQVPAAERPRVQELVDRFARLRSEGMRLEADLERAAHELHLEAERLGVHRLAGKTMVAVRRKEGRPPLSARGSGKTRNQPSGPTEPEGSTVPHSGVTPTPNARRPVRWYWELDENGSAYR